MVSAGPHIRGEVDLPFVKVADVFHLRVGLRGRALSVCLQQEMLEWFKSQKRLHKKYALQILQKATEILRSYRSVVDVDIPEGTTITVCGDTHGQ